MRLHQEQIDQLQQALDAYRTSGNEHDLERLEDAAALLLLKPRWLADRQHVAAEAEGGGA
jgi:hypothetical protein